MRADQVRAVESLLSDLSTVADEVMVEGGLDGPLEGQVVRYKARPLGLFADRILPPELEVMRVLMVLRDARRLTIVEQTPDGKAVRIMLRAGVSLTVAPALFNR